MGTRVKTFDASGVAPGGRLFAGDLNAIQDAKADSFDLTQEIGLATLRIGESGLSLVRFGAGEARITGALRTDGILRSSAGLLAPSMTTSARNALASGVGLTPYGLVILNTTTNQYEWNKGDDTTRNWQPLGLASVTGADIADGSITAAKISSTLKPSGSAAAGTEALRALGTTAGTAAAGDDSRFNTQIVFNTQTGSYTLVLSDRTKMIYMNHAGAANLIVPTNATVPFSIGDQIHVVQAGAGQVSIAPAVGVTVVANPGLKTGGQWAVATLLKTGTDTWLFYGNVTS